MVTLRQLSPVLVSIGHHPPPVRTTGHFLPPFHHQCLGCFYLYTLAELSSYPLSLGSVRGCCCRQAAAAATASLRRLLWAHLTLCFGTLMAISSHATCSELQPWPMTVTERPGLNQLCGHHLLLQHL